jgi:hypothetical protein
MPNKNEPANNSLTNAGPIEPDGSSDETSAQAAHLTGVPDSLPETWCPNCQANVKPKGKGLCPRCSRFLKNSFAARKHPVNVLRRDALLAKLVAEYRPSTQRLLSACEQYAGVLEQLEVMKPGSQEHKRLVELSELLAAALEESRPPASTPTNADLTHDQLIERTTEILRQLLAQRDDFKRYDEMSAGYCHPAGVDGSPFPEGSTQSTRGSLQERPDSSLGASLAQAGTNVPRASWPVVPRPEPARCQYCGQSPCVGPEHVAFDVLHWLDPLEVDRRAKAYTAEMIESLRRQRS